MKKVHHPEGEIEPFKDTRSASDSELLERGADVVKDSPDLPVRLEPTAEQIERIKEERLRVENIMRSDLPTGAAAAVAAERIMRAEWESPDAAALDGRDSDIPTDLIPTIINSRITSGKGYVDTVKHWAHKHPGDQGVLDTLSLANERYAALIEHTKKFDRNASAVEQQAVAGEVIRAWHKLKKMTEGLEPAQRPK